uniref:Elongator complex protein 4 n=1 Tax=Spongospora subterranea TaxID=70186 RepID=A0A0H5QJU6_9EUKA|eukprot:CRZ01606.1 hypothetical protein [Spongospora subterranea]
MSSFRRHSAAINDMITPTIPGVRRWLNGSYLTSSGIPGFDESLGGGLPVKSFVLIKHDTPSSNYLTWLRCFLAEGIGRGHCVVQCSPDDSISPSTIPMIIAPKKKKPQSEAPQQFKISWRYQNSAKPSSTSPVSSLNFDLSRSMSSESWKANAPFLISLRSFSEYHYGSQNYFDDLLTRVRSHLAMKKCMGEDGVPFNMARVIIHSPVSPFLGCDPNSSLRSLVKFFHGLKALARESFSIIMVSLPVDLMSSEDVSRLEYLSDIVLSMHSFIGKPAIYGPFDGIMRIEKSSSTLNVPESDEFLFKLKKTEVIVERVALPVETSDKELQADSSACSGALPATLQF